MTCVSEAAVRHFYFRCPPLHFRTCSVEMAPSVARSRQTKSWPSLATDPTRKPWLALAPSSGRKRMSTA